MTARLMLEKGVQLVRGASYCGCLPFVAQDLPHLVGFIGHLLDLAYEDVEELIRDQICDSLPEPPPYLLPMDNGSSRSCVCWEVECCSGLTFGTFQAAQEHERRCPVWGRIAQAAATGACFRCGRTSHWAEDCFATSHVDGSVLIDSDCDSPCTPSSSRLLRRTASLPLVHTSPAASQSKNCQSPLGGCGRCGRASHKLLDCFASTYADGSHITSFDSSHSYDDSAPSRILLGVDLPTDATTLSAAKRSRSATNIDMGACARCGRSSHKSSECFANTHGREQLLNRSSHIDENARGKRRDGLDRVLASGGCFRCGRPGHAAKNCYASRSADGRWLD